MSGRRRRARTRARAVTTTTVVLAVGLIAFVGVAAGRQYTADRDFHPIRVPAASALAPAVAAELAGLAAATPATAATGPVGPAPTATGLGAALGGRLASSALGTQTAARVIDVGTGNILLDRNSAASMSPASTAKLMTAAALLRVHRVTDRFATTVVGGVSPGSVVLVGGGDPTLTSAAGNQRPAYDGAARISDLAAQLKKSGTPVTSISVDDSLFTGPLTAPGWAPADAPSEYASPITSLMIDGGRDSPSAVIRSATPALAAGRALAAAMGLSLPVVLATRPAGTKLLARVESAPVGELVEQMLRQSDDVVAEVLGRQVASALGQPASFAGAATAITTAMAGIGVSTGSAMRDASGLSTLDRLSATALASVLVASVNAQHPELHAIVAALPVAGWDGTLADRFGAGGPAASGRGLVRAKTGTLGDQGVNTEAGFVTDQDGRDLVFVLMTSGAAGVDSSRAALDLLAGTLAGCGCH